MAGRELLTDKTVGILGVVAGGVMLALTVADVYALEYQGAFCLAAGAVLWRRAVRNAVAEQKVEASFAALEGRDHEVDSLLADGASLNAVAAGLHARHGVSSDAMLVVLTAQLRAWLDHGTDAQRTHAARLVSAQRHHDTPPPEAVLARLHEPGIGICRDDTAIGGAHPPSLMAGRRGTLALTPWYLFFLPMTPEEAGRTGISTGVLAVDAIAMAAEAFSVVRAGYRNPFAAKDAARLRARFSRPDSFALPLGQITALRVTRTFAPTQCLEVEWRDDHGNLHQRWLDTTLREASTDAEPQPASWLDQWTHRLRLIALADGNDIAPPVETPPVALARKHAHYLPPEAPRTPAQRRDRLTVAGLAFAVLVACWTFAFVLISSDNGWGLGALLVGLLLPFVVGAYGMKEPLEARRRLRLPLGVSAAILVLSTAVAVQWVDAGHESGIALFLAAVVVSCLIVVLAFRHVTRTSPTDTAVATLLETRGGLAQLLASPRAAYLPPAERVRMDAASVLLLAAQSGDPERRRWADHMAANQTGAPLRSPADALQSFASGGLYFPGEAAVLNPSAPVAGVMFVGAQYLFFLAGATAPPSTGFDPDASTLSRLHVALSHPQSVAIPVRDIRTIDLATDADPTMTLTFERDGAPVTIEFHVGENHQSGERAVRTGFWMTRIQWACAAEGNLLRWDETRPRVVTATH